MDDFCLFGCEPWMSSPGCPAVGQQIGSEITKIVSIDRPALPLQAAVFDLFDASKEIIRAAGASRRKDGILCAAERVMPGSCAGHPPS